MTRSQRHYLEHTISATSGLLLALLSERRWVVGLGLALFAVGWLGRTLTLRRITLDGERP